MCLPALTTEGDTVACREASLKKEYFKKLLRKSNPGTVPVWLTLDRAKLVGQVVILPIPDEAIALFDGKSIVEYTRGKEVRI